MRRFGLRNRLGVFLLALVACTLAMAVPVTAERSVVYERSGDFVLYRGSATVEKLAITAHRIMLSNRTFLYETEVLLPSGEWSALSRDGGDRLLEYQFFTPGKTYRVLKEAVLYQEPVLDERFQLSVKAVPDDYTVHRKVYDFVELTLLDGTKGWLNLPENDTAQVLTMPGYFLDEKSELDLRVSRDLTIKSAVAAPATRVQTTMVPEYVTVHNASNFSENANASWHAYQFSVLTRNPLTTYHFVVDEQEAILLQPLNEVAYHAGDRFLHGNGASIAIEICDYQNGKYYAQAERNGAKLAATILYQFGLPKDRLRFHKDWNGKDCPLSMLEMARGSVGIEAFREMVYAEYDALVSTYGAAYTPPLVQTPKRQSGPQDASVLVSTNYGVLPWVAFGSFILVIVLGIIHSVRRASKKR